MRDPPLSTIEKDFILSALATGKRVDGRALDEIRDLDLQLGSEWGSCIATLGETVVLGQVTCELTEPQMSRPNEGVLRVDVDFSGMAGAPYAEGKTQEFQEEIVELQRIMERCFRESGCLDLESLCVVSESVVWSIRLSLSVLNHAGNLAAAASVAGLAALSHFKRPEVSLKGDKVTVHPVSEKDPVPLSIHHHPTCSTFAFFSLPSSSSGSTHGKVICVDPLLSEEQVMLGKLVFGVNPYREICTLHLAGNMLIDKGVVLRYAHQASEHAKNVVDLIKNRIATDVEARQKGDMDQVGYAAKLLAEQLSILNNEKSSADFDLSKIVRVSGNPKKIADDSTESEVKMIIEDGLVSSTAEHEEVVEMIGNDDDNEVKILKKGVKSQPKAPVTNDSDDEESSEDEAVAVVGETQLKG